MRKWLLVVGLVFAANGVEAQEPANALAGARLQAQGTLPPQLMPRVTPEEARQLEAAAAVQPAAVASGRSVAYMVAGGALFVAGALVGGDAGTLLMVGGAVIGAYGIYLYFR